MKTLIRKNKRLKKFQVFSLAVLLLASCKPVERIVNHTEYINKTKFDSIYFSKHDSIYVEKKGDNIRISTYQKIYKDRIRLQKDTVIRTDTVKTVYQKTITKSKNVLVYGFFWWFGFVAFIIGLAFGIIKLVSWSPFQSVFKKLLKIN